MILTFAFILLYTVAFILAAMGLYVLAAFTIMMIPRHRFATDSSSGIIIYLYSNGVHTDFIIPAQHHLVNWWNFLNKNDYPTDTQYLAMGWGDRGFYLDTPTWAELKFKTAANALLIPSPTVMHITAHADVPSDGVRFAKVVLSDRQYIQICNYISAGFKLDEHKNIDLLEGCGYERNDQFYSANGDYTALQTCNQWINRGLNQIGVRSALWTATDRGIFYQLNKRKVVLEPVMGSLTVNS